MFQWNAGIYMDDKVKEKPAHYRRIVGSRRLIRSCYCITLPVNSENCMDIYSSREFWFRHYRKQRLEIIGLAADWDGVEKILCEMTQDIMESCGEVNAKSIKQYFKKKLPES